MLHLVTVAKQHWNLSGSTTEIVKEVPVDTCAKFHAFITLRAIFTPIALTIMCTYMNNDK